MNRNLRLRPFELYFWASLALGVVAFAFSIVSGKAGFSLTPLINAIWAILIAVSSSVFIIRLIFNNKTLTLPRNGILIFTLILLTLVFGSVIGIVEGNSKIYVLATTIYWLNWQLFAVVLNEWDTDYSRERFEFFLGRYLPILSVITIFGAKNTANGMVFLATTLILSVTFLKSRKLFFWSIIPFVFTLSSLNRGILLALGGGLFIAALMRRSGIMVLLFTFLGLAMVSFLTFGDLSIILPPGTQLFRRLNEIQQLITGMNSIDNMVALQQRLFEIRMVNDAVYADTGSLLFGKGFGATIDMRASADMAVTGSALLGVEKVHNIHSLFHALLLRSGYLGLLFLMAFVFTLCAQIWHAFKIGCSDPIVVFCIIFVSTSFLNGIPASNFFLTEFGLLGLLIFARTRMRAPQTITPPFLNNAAPFKTDLSEVKPTLLLASTEPSQ